MVIRALQLVPGSKVGAGSLPRPPRLGALPAVPCHPARAQALLPAVVRVGAVGGAPRAVLAALLPARRRREHPLTTAAPRLPPTPPSFPLPRDFRVGGPPARGRK